MKQTPRQQKNLLILLVLLFAAIVLIGSIGGGGGGTKPDLSDPVWDGYFDCTARWQSTGHTLNEAYELCKQWRP